MRLEATSKEDQYKCWLTDDDLEAGFVTLVGGLAMLADKVEVGISLVLLGGLVVLLSEKTELRGTGA